MTGYEPTYWYIDPYRAVRMLSNNPMARAMIGGIGDELLRRAWPDLRIGDVFRVQKLDRYTDIERVARTLRERPRPASSYRCVYCRRNFWEKVPHSCCGTFRKRGLSWQALDSSGQVLTSPS